MNPIYIITGPPAAGKTTLCQATAKRFERAVHIQVDELRLWVTQGLSDSVPWTEETERQFQVAELAACDIARRYQDAGFAVMIDHCRNLERLEQLIAEELSGRHVVRVCLLPTLERNLRRNRERTNKDFDPAILEDVIRHVHAEMSAAEVPGWHMPNNSQLNLREMMSFIRSVPKA